MSNEVLQSALYLRLTQRSQRYSHKAKELRERILEWLNYIPETFPHYTRHTVAHSDEIILQLSNLLFHDGDSDRPSVDLSGVEMYILVCAAYLHDAGMVCSDSEKKRILESAEWRAGTTEPQMARRLSQIEALRHSTKLDREVRNFLADLEVRFLIAEFIRRRHHWRAADVIAVYEPALENFAFGDPSLLRSITAVCVGHGLSLHELDDTEEYPHERDHRGEKANIRFLASLFRLGDLLDMSYDRACPLLLNVASPIPADSLAHWTQYQRITHRVVSPRRIEITADCESQTEHRILHDWCKWIVDEVSRVGAVMRRSRRHSDWQAPVAGLGVGGDDATIRIRPSGAATYIPSSWKLELDHETILDRLINDIYDDPAVFVRELLQNACDANRCQMYSDLERDGAPLPDYPVSFSIQVRKQYPIRLGLFEREHRNELSGLTENRQWLYVDDCGIGMDEETIRRFFLQIGRSFYTSPEFRRKFRFVPTSRFGVGFLSVFSVSNHVRVETYREGPSAQPILFELTGLSSYLLTERGTRTRPGTRVELLLNERLPDGRLTEVVRSYCRRVEFPVVVDEGAVATSVEAETSADFEGTWPDVTDANSHFAVKAFPINEMGVFGEVYVGYRVTPGGEDWSRWSWAQYTYPKKHPAASAPPLPERLICIHGISASFREAVTGPLSWRLDFRNSSLTFGTSRRHIVMQQGMYDRLTGRSEISYKVIRDKVESILREHLGTTPLASGDDGWKYKQALSGDFPIDEFWDREPEMLPIHHNGKKLLLSMGSVRSFPELRILYALGSWRDRINGPERTRRLLGRELEFLGESTIPSMASAHLNYVGDRIHRDLFAGLVVVHVTQLAESVFDIAWRRAVHPSERATSVRHGDRFFIVPTTGFDKVGFEAHNLGPAIHAYLLNAAHPFVEWLMGVRPESSSSSAEETRRWQTLLGLVSDVLRLANKQHVNALNHYVSEWPSKGGPPLTSSDVVDPAFL